MNMLKQPVVQRDAGIHYSSDPVLPVRVRYRWRNRNGKTGTRTLYVVKASDLDTLLDRWNKMNPDVWSYKKVA